MDSTGRSEGAKIAGGVVGFTACGQDWKLAPQTLEVEIAFEDWLLSRALQRLQRLGGQSYDPIAVEAKLHRDAASGQFEPGSEAWANAMRSNSGLGHMLLLRLRPHHPVVTPARVKQLIEEIGFVRAYSLAVLGVYEVLDEGGEGKDEPAPQAGESGDGNSSAG